MNTRHLLLTCALSLGASMAIAQGTAAAADPAAKAQDCVARHDHGAERQVPTPKKGCKPAAKVVKATPDAKEKPVQGHDHGKFHKNQ